VNRTWRCTIFGWLLRLFSRARIPLTVTFDSNTLDRVVRPDRFPKDPLRPAFLKINQALKEERVNGFFSETILTLEGIQKADRADVFDSTVIVTRMTEKASVTGEPARVSVELTVHQPGRKPIHPEVAMRVKAALQLGLRALKIPRQGAITIEDPHKTFFVQQNKSEMEQRQQKTFEAARQIEGRGVGMSRVKALAAKFAARDNVTEPWYRSLVRAKDIHEENDVKRAIAEWSDADTMAAHIGYGIQFFCTEDLGRGAVAASILDSANRFWLTQNYGVRFVTLSELAKKLC
jgi:hypothetical protein